MSAAVDEQMTLEVIFVDEVAGEQEQNRLDVLEANRQASEVESESLTAFLDLLAAADAEYMAAASYVEPARPESTLPGLDWDTLHMALAESQRILINVQELLSETLAGIGVEDHAHIRVYADEAGALRLITDHPRQTEIENLLNSPENQELRNLHAAAMAGMSLAGNLVGSMTSMPSAA